MNALELKGVLGRVPQYLAIVAKDTKNGGCKLPCDIAPVLPDSAAGTCSSNSLLTWLLYLILDFHNRPRQQLTLIPSNVSIA